MKATRAARDNEYCEAPRCRHKAVIRYLGKDLCEYHFGYAAQDNQIRKERDLGVRE